MRVLSVAAAALCLFPFTAKADTFLFTVVRSASEFPLAAFTATTTVPVPAITGQTMFNLSQFTFTGAQVATVALVLDSSNTNYGPAGSIVTLDSGGAVISASDLGFTPAQYDTAGTYTLVATNTNGGGNNTTTTLTVTDLPAGPVTVTPEPSSLTLLGTGLLGVGGVVRKRFTTSK